MSVQGTGIDEVNAITHWLMLVLFVGWGSFFIVSLVKFRASKNKKADYGGAKSHISSLLEAAVAVIEILVLFGFAFLSGFILFTIFSFLCGFLLLTRFGCDFSPFLTKVIGW